MENGKLKMERGKKKCEGAKGAKKGEISQAEEYVSNLQELHKIQGVLLARLSSICRFRVMKRQGAERDSSLRSE